MAAKPIAMEQLKQVLKLKQEGHSIKSINRLTGIFHSIVYHRFQWIVYQRFSPKFTILLDVGTDITAQSLPLLIPALLLLIFHAVALLQKAWPIK